MLDAARQWQPVTESSRFARARIVRAESEAEQIIAQARHEAAAIVANAHEAAASIRQDAMELGADSGAAAAEENEKARWRERIAALNASVAAVVDAIASEREQVWLDSTNELASLALEIARKVIKIEVNQQPDLVLTIVRDALRRVSDRDNLRIRVSPDDLGILRAHRDDLVSALDSVRGLEIVDDRRVGRGGCTIETPSGTFDARIETQLAQVQRALLQ